MLDPIIAIDRIMDSVWVIRGRFLENGKVYISRYSRDDREAYETEREHPMGYLIESDEGRTVVGLARYAKGTSWFDRGDPDEEFFVSNPKHVFDYDCHCSESEGGSYFVKKWRSKEEIQEMCR